MITTRVTGGRSISLPSQAKKTKKIKPTLADNDRQRLKPACQENNDPVLPGWIHSNNPRKWEGEEGKELARKASKWVLKNEGAIRDNGSVDLEILKTRNWSEIFYDKKYGLGGMLVSCGFTKNIFEAIKLAIPESIGLEENQVKPWEITYRHMWQMEDSEGRLLIDHVTKYLIEKYLPQKYKLNLLKENGRLDAAKAKEINWSRLYVEVCPSALVNSSVKAHEALKRYSPNLFGYEDNQIKPWELRWENKWEGSQGKELFKKAFIYTLAKAGFGELDFTTGVKAIFTKESLDERLKQSRPNLQKIITDNGLMLGLRKSYSGNLSDAIASIFSAPEEIEKTRDLIKYLQAIIEDKGNYVLIDLEDGSKHADSHTEPLKNKTFTSSKQPDLSWTTPLQNDLNKFKRIKEPSFYDLSMLKKLYDLYSPNFTTLEQDTRLPPNFSRKIENYRPYEEDGVPVSYFHSTKLTYQMFLYSLDMHYPLAEVFTKFVKENIESGKKRFEKKKELRDLSKLSPTEVFQLACLCNLKSGIVNKNNQLNYNEVESLKLVIKGMNIPWSNEGILELKKYLVNNPEAEKYITEAFKSVTRQTS